MMQYLAAIVLWLAALALCSWVLGAAVRSVGGLVRSAGFRRRQALVVLMLGAVAFAGGLYRHSHGLDSMCCGDVTAAERLAR